MDATLFQTLGFTRNETIVYLALVESGRNSAHALAKKANLARSTVYSVLDSLHAQNLISKSKIRGSTFFQAENPVALHRKLTRREEELKMQQRATSLLVEGLLPLFKSATPNAPRMEYVEGKAKVEKFLESYLVPWSQSMLKLRTSTWGYQDPTFPELYKGFIKRLWDVIHTKHGVQGKILSSPSPAESALVGKVQSREVRVLGKEFQFQSSLWIMGEFVIVIQTRHEPIYASQFHDPLLAANLRVIFQHLYDQAKPMPTGK